MGRLSPIAWAICFSIRHDWKRCIQPCLKLTCVVARWNERGPILCTSRISDRGISGADLPGRLLGDCQNFPTTPLGSQVTTAKRGSVRAFPIFCDCAEPRDLRGGFQRKGGQCSTCVTFPNRRNGQLQSLSMIRLCAFDWDVTCSSAGTSKMRMSTVLFEIQVEVIPTPSSLTEIEPASWGMPTTFRIKTSHCLAIPKGVMPVRFES